MNRVYRLIWNELARAWVAVAEIARGRGKRGSAQVLAASLALIGAPAWALDAGALPIGASQRHPGCRLVDEPWAELWNR